MTPAEIAAFRAIIAALIGWPKALDRIKELEEELRRANTEILLESSHYFDWRVESGVDALLTENTPESTERAFQIARATAEEELREEGLI